MSSNSSIRPLADWFFNTIEWGVLGLFALIIFLNIWPLLLIGLIWYFLAGNPKESLIFTVFIVVILSLLSYEYDYYHGGAKHSKCQTKSASGQDYSAANAFSVAFTPKSAEIEQSSTSKITSPAEASPNVSSQRKLSPKIVKRISEYKFSKFDYQLAHASAA